MILERFPEIKKLSPDEQEQLYAELGDLLMGSEVNAERDAAILELLEHRHAEYLRDPSLARPAEEVLARLRSRYNGPRE
jgi:putative addiction module component (TIGR02574 family)